MKKRHKPEQIVRKLREADAQLSSGAKIADVCIRLEVSEATYHRWRKQYSGIEVQTLKRLRALEPETTAVRIPADLEGTGPGGMACEPQTNPSVVARGGMANLQAGKEETALGLKREWLHAASSRAPKPCVELRLRVRPLSANVRETRNV
jgi:putative transposase